MSASYRIAFQSWFGLTAAEADALCVLYARNGDPLALNAFAYDIGCTPMGTRLIVHRLRHALETEAIDFERGQGYRLTELGMGECRAILWSVGEELRSAS